MPLPIIPSDVKQFYAVGHFRGRNGSLGFKTDHDYQLKVTVQRTGILVETDDGKACVYRSLFGFMVNWGISRVNRGRE